MNREYEPKLFKKTLCGDCIWIDFDTPDKYTNGYYFCRKRRKQVKMDLNTCCEYWKKR